MNLSPQQLAASAQVTRWMNSNEQLLRFFGFAGVGKTTLAKYLVQLARKRWIFAAFTGKAAHVLRTKGCENAATIHSLIYRPAGTTRDKEIKQLEARIEELSAQTFKAENEALDELNAQIVQLQVLLKKVQAESEVTWALWANSPLTDPDVEGIVIDECSMVDERMGKDLESFGKKILVLGDPAQLPPIGGGGYFTEQEPDILLTEVHRHAKESGILRLATFVREGGDIMNLADEWDQPSDCLLKKSWLQLEDARAEIMLKADQVLVGRNATRKRFNAAIRSLLGYTKLLVPGDRLVCLKNDRSLGVYNGSQWRVEQIDEIDVANREATVTLRSEDDDGMVITAAIWLQHFFGEGPLLEQMGWDRYERAEFDYGYALTVHKAQGSQWGNVVLCDESSAFKRDARRWLYTGVTRAAKKLTVLL